jgi:hypothetical protein
MAAIAREQPNVVSTSLMAALNDAFDQATAERFAHYLRLTSPIFWLLIGMTLLGMAALVFQLGLTGKRVHMMASVPSVMWAVPPTPVLNELDVSRWLARSRKRLVVRRIGRYSSNLAASFEARGFTNWF